METIDQTVQALLVNAVDFLPHLIAALVTFIAGLFLSGFFAGRVRRALEARGTDRGTSLLLCRLTRWSILTIATLVALDQVNFNITGFLAGVGAAGFTVGFALQDISRDFLAGILLLVRQPFAIGDAVTVGGYDGSVLDITMRDTVIKTWDGEVVIIPNNQIFENPITNYSQVTRRRRTIMIGLGYGQDVAHAMQVFLDALRSVPGVLQEPAPTVLAESMGDSALVLAARFWVDQQANGLFDVHSNAVLALDAAAEREGIKLPYPIQVVQVKQLPGSN